MGLGLGLAWLIGTGTEIHSFRPGISVLKESKEFKLINQS